jgi:hypothetical protein
MTWRQPHAAASRSSGPKTERIAADAIEWRTFENWASDLQMTFTRTALPARLEHLRDRHLQAFVHV